MDNKDKERYPPWTATPGYRYNDVLICLMAGVPPGNTLTKINYQCRIIIKPMIIKLMILIFC